MMLQWLDAGLDIELCENEVNVVVLEHPEVYTAFMNDLINSLEKGNEAILLYENNKKLNLNKSVEIIFSPLLLDFNSKKIQQYLYDELKQLSDEFCYEIKENINSMIVQYFENMSSRLQYPIEFDLCLDEKRLYKQYDLHIEYEDEDLTEKTINYIQIMSSLCGSKVLIFINAKAYFTSEQLEEIYRNAFLNKMQIILLENTQNSCLSYEKYSIVDKDKCFIHFK